MFVFVFFFSSFETRSQYITLAGLEQVGLELIEICLPLVLSVLGLKACTSTPALLDFLLGLALRRNTVVLHHSFEIVAMVLLRPLCGQLLCLGGSSQPLSV